MSIALPLVDLTSKPVGATGNVSFQNAGIGIGGADSNPAFTKNRPSVNIYNDSGKTLQITFIQSPDSDILPPGAWRSYSLDPGEAGYTWKILSLMNVSEPISQLSTVYFFPSEGGAVGTLGNSPIGGGVTTSSVQTLSNEGGARGGLVIDIGDLALANLIQFFTDSFLLKVDQAGVAHQVLKGQTSGNPLQIGQTGDVSEVLGQLTVDQALNLPGGVAGAVTFTGDIAANGAGTGLNVANNELVGGTLGVTGISTFTGNIVANGGMNNNTIRDNVAGNPAMDLSAGDGTVAFPQIIKPNKAGQVSNGSVAGTVTLYTPIWGNTLKIAVLAFAGWNQGAAQVTFTLPTTVARGVYYMGNLGGFIQIGLGTSGTVGGMTLSTSLGNATAAGNTVVSHALGAFSNSLGELTATAAQIIINNGSNGSVLNGAFAFIGV